VKRPIKNSILCHYSCEVKIFKNKPETSRGPDPARGSPAGRQLVIAGLKQEMSSLTLTLGLWVGIPLESCIQVYVSSVYVLVFRYCYYEALVPR
jgi:hypothetical protein